MRHLVADDVDRAQAGERGTVADEHALATVVVEGVVVVVENVGGDVGGGVVAVERIPAQGVLQHVVGVHQAPQRVDPRGLAVGIGGAAAREVILAVAPAIGGVGEDGAGAAAVVGVGDRHRTESAADAAGRILHAVHAVGQGGADRHAAVVLAVAGADHRLERLPLLEHMAVGGADHGVVVDRPAATHQHAGPHQVSQCIAGDPLFQVQRVELAVDLVGGRRRPHRGDDREHDQFDAGFGDLHPRREDRRHRHLDRTRRCNRWPHAEAGIGAAGRDAAGAVAEARAAVGHRLADDLAGVVGHEYRLGLEHAHALISVLQPGDPDTGHAGVLGGDGIAVVAVEAALVVGRRHPGDQRRFRGFRLRRRHSQRRRQQWLAHHRIDGRRRVAQHERKCGERGGDRFLATIHVFSSVGR